MRVRDNKRISERQIQKDGKIERKLRSKNESQR